MPKLKIILFLFSLNSMALIGQDTLNSSVQLTIGMNSLDFQTGLAYTHSWGRVQGFTALEFGINRTIFQSRPFPRMTIGGAYKLVTRKYFFIGPMLSFSHSLLKVNKQSDYLTTWNELYLGARMELGAKWRFIYSMAAGWQNERFFNTFSNNKSGVNSLGFYVNLGLAYAW